MCQAKQRQKKKLWAVVAGLVEICHLPKFQINQVTNFNVPIPQPIN